MELRDDALPDPRGRARSRSARASSSRATSSSTSSRARRRAGELDDGSTVPITQTAATVTLPDILDTLDSDVRTDLQTLPPRVRHGGARGRRREGVQPRDPVVRAGLPLRRAHQRRAAGRGARPRHPAAAARASSATFAALGDNPEALKELVTDLNTTAGAIASQDEALEAAVPALRDTLRVGYPALGRAERRAADAAHVLARGAAGRALLGADARRGDPLDRAGARAGAGERAEGAGGRPAPGRAGPRAAEQPPGAVPARSCARCPRARTTCWCRSWSRRSRASRSGNSGHRCASRSTAASWASRARAA